jgi:protein TonB
MAAPRYRSHPSPLYPIESLRRREEGVVLLDVEVGPDGRASQISLNHSSGFPSLDGAAVDAVYAWSFEPARAGGLPVSTRVVVPVRFSLVGR